MPPGTLTPTFRLDFLYSVLGLDHRMRFYVDAVPSADALGYDLVQRSSMGNVPGSDAIDAWWARLAGMFAAADVTFGAATLMERTGSLWNPVGAYTTGATAGAAGSSREGDGMVIAIKSTGNQSMPIVLLELNSGGIHRYISYAAISAATQSVVNGATNAGGTAVSGDVYFWRLSRSGGYTGRWLSVVTDSNQKMRRIRHLT